MKKRIFVALLALILSASAALIACDNGSNSGNNGDGGDGGDNAAPHTHAFAEAWTTDDTHHWHAATCEHTAEVSEKGEHTFGAGNKCTACQMEKPGDGMTVTAEVWAAECGKDRTNWVRAGGYDPYTTIVEVDGSNKWQVSQYINGHFDGVEINHLENGVCTRYFKGGSDAKYTKMIYEYYQGSYAMFVGELDIVKGVKDEFDSFTYDEESKVYTFDAGDRAIMEGLDAKNAVYKVAFENGELVSFILTATLDFGEGPKDCTYNFTFGIANVTIPTADEVQEPDTNKG